MPYWTTDIGGFFRPGKSQYTDEEYQELLMRWYQWGAFNPIFRIHGFQSETEPWHYSQQVQGNMRKMLNLRYRLLPYIYSEAWQITKNGATMMRPLVMDFQKDTLALNQDFEFMFGKAILVSPITEPKVNKWKVYLPKSIGWYNFWTGQNFDGEQIINTDAPLDKIPLFVKAGSIIPMGPVIQYAAEKNDPLEIRIYPGTNGEFTLYEDENDNYDYEKGIYSAIKFKWNDATKTLIIGKRSGNFPGMIKNRTFNIIIISQNCGTGIEISRKITKVVKYSGQKVNCAF